MVTSEFASYAGGGACRILGKGGEGAWRAEVVEDPSGTASWTSACDEVAASWAVGSAATVVFRSATRKGPVGGKVGGVTRGWLLSFVKIFPPANISISTR